MDDATRSAARQLGTEGVEAYQAGDFATATDRLERAFELLSVPSLGLWSARALEKNGLWIEAAERYLTASRLSTEAGGDAAVQEQAKQDATAGYDSLQARIPKLIIEASGPETDDLTVVAGDREIKRALIGAPIPMNPGEVEVLGRSRGREAKEMATLQEGATSTVTLQFEPVAPADPAPEQARNLDPAPPAGSSPQQDLTHNHPGTLRWVGLGAGVVGLVGVGVGLFLGNKAVKDADASDCDAQRRCSPEGLEDRNDAQDLLRLSYGIGVGGSVLAAGGATLFLLSPSGSSGSVAVKVHGPGSGFTGLSINGRL